MKAQLFLADQDDNKRRFRSRYACSHKLFLTCCHVPLPLLSRPHLCCSPLMYVTLFPTQGTGVESINHEPIIYVYPIYGHLYKWHQSLQCVYMSVRILHVSVLSSHRVLHCNPALTSPILSLMTSLIQEPTRARRLRHWWQGVQHSGVCKQPSTVSHTLPPVSKCQARGLHLVGL